MLSLGSILYALLLFINAVAILSEDRFLARVGWSSSGQLGGQDPYGVSDGPGVKARLVNLISAVRTLMRIPLIGFNTLVILYLLVLG